MSRLSAQFVTDVQTRAEQASAAAGDRDVMMHGAGAAQALLRVGLPDELEIQLVPVLLGDRRRLFSTPGLGHIEPELMRRMEARDTTHLRHRAHGAR